MFPQYQDPVVTEEIDGLNYTSSKFPATKALDLMLRTTKVLGDHGLRLLVTSGFAELQGLLGAAMTPAIVQVAYGLAEDLALCKELCGQLKCNSLRPGGGSGSVASNFDLHFQGELVHLFRVLAFVLKHNFLGFTLGAHLTAGNHTGAEEKSS